MMKKISVLCALALIFLGIRTTELFLTHSPWFELRLINISGNEELRDDQVLKLSGLRLNRNIFKINSKDIIKKIKSDKRVESVQLSKFYPGKIQIRLNEKKPDLLLSSRYLPDLYGLSAEGEVIPLKGYYSYDLPLISGVNSKNLEPYSKVKDLEIRTALSFYKIVEEEDPSFLNKISEINLEDKNNLVVVMVRTGAKIFFGAGDFKEKFKRFIWIKDKLNYEGFSGMDLRFKDQMIFKGTSKSL
jgi:cell division protein FtsQ